MSENGPTPVLFRIVNDARAASTRPAAKGAAFDAGIASSPTPVGTGARVNRFTAIECGGVKLTFGFLSFGKRSRLAWPLGLLCAAACWSAAAAADGKAAGPSEALFLVQIIILVIVGRLLGEAMVRLGQPSIMGQIIGGILLGPSVFGLIAPGAQAALFPDSDAQKAMADAVAQLGILFLLLLAGMETVLA